MAEVPSAEQQLQDIAWLKRLATMLANDRNARYADHDGQRLDRHDARHLRQDRRHQRLGEARARHPHGLLGQCYDLGRAEDAHLAGSITIRFTLVGEPDIGGLLERVEIVDPNTTITQQTIRDCLTQQLYALELDPPPDGVTVERELHLEVP